MRSLCLIMLPCLILLQACTNSSPANYRVQASFVDAVSDTEVTTILDQLTLNEKLGQLYIWRTDLQAPTTENAFEEAAKEHQLGGIILEAIPLGKYLEATTLLHQNSTIQPFIGASSHSLLNNLFTDGETIPSALAITAANDDSLQLQFQKTFQDQLQALGVNWVFDESQKSTRKTLKDRAVLNTLPLTRIPDDIENNHFLSSPATISGITISSELYLTDSLRYLPWGENRRRLQQRLNFDGLVLFEAQSMEEVEVALKSGAHAIVGSVAPQAVIAHFESKIKNGSFTVSDLDERVRQILKAKQWMRKSIPLNRKPVSRQVAASMDQETGNALSLTKEMLYEHFQAPYWGRIHRKVMKQSAVLVNNKEELLPFDWIYKRGFKITHIGPLHLKAFDDAFEKYANASAQHLEVKGTQALPSLSELSNIGWTHIITLSGLSVDPMRDKEFLQSLKVLATASEVVVVNFGHPQNLEGLDTSLSLVQFFEINKMTAELAPQLLFGGFSPTGILPIAVNDYFPEGTGLTFEPTRMEFASPEEVGIASEKLTGIEDIANAAIRDKAMPGCQVLVAKQGKIIYSKSFGYHTYDKKQPVRNTDLYDIASITKVAATTLSTMHLYEGKQIELSDKLKEHLELPSSSSIKNLQLRKLLTHQSGLKPHLPVIPYLVYRDQPNAGCDSFFCKIPGEEYATQVADSFYFRTPLLEAIWNDINKVKLSKYSKYRYSDANFYLLQKVIESSSNLALDQYVNRKFYYPLGLRYLGFNPMENYSSAQIVPTQEDNRWRQQLVHGHVHDETAALLGGVAGNAGLFSNAEDLAVLFQLLLNGGSYGGTEYLDPATIKLFTTAPKGSQRAYGFDKPYKKVHTAIAPSATRQSYGHTGFTGTCAWVDPSHQLVYIFLSNRIHPNIKNRKLFSDRVRERIHEVVYDALDSFQEKPPKIDLELSKS